MMDSMVRGLLLCWVPLLLVACGRLPNAREAAVHVDVSYDFNAGCIAVVARDKADPAKVAREQSAVLGRAPKEGNSRKADFAVFRREDWGRTLILTITAHEQTCDGPEVDRQEAELTLEQAGTQRLAVSLSAPDADGDGWVALAGGGRDCDDTHAGSNPAVEFEVCDGRDNDCRNGVDDGLAQTDFFLDEDGDGVGAGPAVRACAAPPRHVSLSGDCDDSDARRAPGKLEICDEVDNDCNDLVDDGLATSSYYRDEDGDGFGRQSEVVQRCRAPAGYVEATAVFDCNDSDPTVRPGATEVCNDVDDNCVEGVDEGFEKLWYRDVDGDGYGVASDTRTGCTQPEGYVARTPIPDCDDANPAVNPGATEVCNDVDDNCVNGVDEVFTQKGVACTHDTCSGQFVCNAAGDGTVCNAPARISYYPDADGDTEGSASAAAERLCPSAPAPAGKVANNTDCDDNDPHNRSGGTEVCDDRDNNCAGGKDEGDVCGGKGWRVLNDPVTSARNWNTVALKGPGGEVWLAGEAGALAVRPAGVSAFSDRHQACGNIRWNAAWVRPSDGHVFLAGDGGNLATYNGLTCTSANTSSATGGTTATRPLLGIVGFQSGSTTVVYVVSDYGHIFSWTPGSPPAYRTRRSSSDPYRDIHGTEVSQMLLVGNNNPNDRPEIRGYDGAETRTLHTLSGVPTTSNDSLNGVWAWGPGSAYAVGKKGTLLRRTGATTWAYANPVPTMQVDLNSVVAFDDSSVYIASEDGAIRRPVPGAWGLHFNAGASLKDIAATSRQDIWAVGHGFVVHFPE
jgi:hypothetical protein